MKICPNCKSTYPDTRKFCVKCGGALVHAQEGGEAEAPRRETGGRKCPRCGKLCPPYVVYCIECGTKLPDGSDTDTGGSGGGGGKPGGKSALIALGVILGVLAVGIGVGAAFHFIGSDETTAAYTEATREERETENPKEGSAEESSPVEEPSEAEESSSAAVPEESVSEEVTEPTTTVSSGEEVAVTPTETETSGQSVGVATPPTTAAPVTSILPYTDNLLPNPDLCLRPEDFALCVGKKKRFSFYYPKYLFNHSEGTETDYRLWYEYDDHSIPYSLHVYEVKDKTDDRVQRVKELAKPFENRIVLGFYDVDTGKESAIVKVHAKEKKIENPLTGKSTMTGYEVMGGYEDSAATKGLYVVVSNNGKYSRVMELIYDNSAYSYTDFYHPVDYIYESIYRGCSFSGSTKDIRSFEEFCAKEN